MHWIEDSIVRVARNIQQQVFPRLKFEGNTEVEHLNLNHCGVCYHFML
jgi:hypothetical protein